MSEKSFSNRIKIIPVDPSNNVYDISTFDGTSDVGLIHHTGPIGPRGPAGPPGSQGLRGPQGIQGERGPSGTVDGVVDNLLSANGGLALSANQGRILAARTNLSRGVSHFDTFAQTLLQAGLTHTDITNLNAYVVLQFPNQAIVDIRRVDKLAKVAHFHIVQGSIVSLQVLTPENQFEDVWLPSPRPTPVGFLIGAASSTAHSVFPVMNANINIMRSN